MTRIRITSRDNPRLKEARKVRNGKSAGLIFIEGLRLSEEAVRSGIAVENCIIRAGFGEGDRERAFLDSLGDRTVDILETDDRSFASLADTKSPQGVILICVRPSSDRSAFESAIKREVSKLNLTVLLDAVNNPANLGAVLRTAEAAGVRGVILTKGSVEPFAAATIRASMGSVFRLPIWEDADLTNIKEFAGRTRSILTAVSAQGGLQYTSIDWKKPRILAFGSEAHGLSSKIRALVQENIRIPMDADVESLNLAVAAGVVLFEARRQAAVD